MAQKVVPLDELLPDPAGVLEILSVLPGLVFFFFLIYANVVKLDLN